MEEALRRLPTALWNRKCAKVTGVGRRWEARKPLPAILVKTIPMHSISLAMWLQV